MLKLPAGHCIFINPAYANRQEASIPMKLKVNVGEGELKRRAYGESKFDLVIKQLKKQTQLSAITTNDIQIRIEALSKIIPIKEQESDILNKELQEMNSEIDRTISTLGIELVIPQAEEHS
jgi:hypothetical protein